MAVIPFPGAENRWLVDVADAALREVVGAHPEGIHLHDAIDLAAVLMKSAVFDGAELALDVHPDALVATLADGMRLLLTPAEIVTLGRSYHVETTSALTVVQVLTVIRNPSPNPSGDRQADPQDAGGDVG